VTFGCRLNAYESEVIKAHAASAGLSDAVVVNTCAVTGEAVRQARQAIRKLRRERPDARVVVTGCAAQIDPQAFAAMPEVDAVVGNAEKMRAETWTTIAPPLSREGERASEPQIREADLVGELGEGAASGLAPIPPPHPVRQPGTLARSWGGLALSPSRGRGGDFPAPEDAEKIRVNDIMSVRETAAHLIDGFADRARAYVEVQNGCDHRCTFCIIPYGRGNSRSVPAGEVVAQVGRLVENGYREVVLTGVDITSWGGDLPGAPRLGRLVRAILAAVPELARLRLSSLDAVEIDPELYDFVTSEERVAPHLHLSLQAGDDLILKRMKRRHSRAEAVALCTALKAKRPEIALGADLIAGFPTESDDMFANTLALVADCGLAFLHVFPFSPRPGTPAARMPQLDRAVIKARAARLRLVGERALAQHLQTHIGQTKDILVEQPGAGRLADFSPVRFIDGALVSGQTARPGAIVDAHITGSDGAALQAEIAA
jgi:threonylcarbamoyladenosine tRNA methylthiotransferase MtaB